MEHNQIKKVREEIGILKSLRTLLLDDNQIRELSASMGNLPGKYIDIVCH